MCVQNGSTGGEGLALLLNFAVRVAPLGGGYLASPSVCKLERDRKANAMGLKMRGNALTSAVETSRLGHR